MSELRTERAEPCRHLGCEHWVPAPSADDAALREIAAWLKGGRRSVAVYNRPDAATVEIWANEAAPKGMHITVPDDYSGHGGSIAEAWAAIQAAEGWRA